MGTVDSTGARAVHSVRRRLARRRTSHGTFCHAIKRIVSGVSSARGSVASTVSSLIILRHDRRGSLTSVGRTGVSVLASFDGLRRTATRRSTSVGSITGCSRRIDRCARRLKRVLSIVSNVDKARSRVGRGINGLRRVVRKRIVRVRSGVTGAGGLLRDGFSRFARLLGGDGARTLIRIVGGIARRFRGRVGSLVGGLVRRGFSRLGGSIRGLGR